MEISSHQSKDVDINLVVKEVVHLQHVAFLNDAIAQNFCSRRFIKRSFIGKGMEIMIKMLPKSLPTTY